MTDFEKEVIEVMQWYSKETTGFCRKEGNGYVQVSQRASAFLNKWSHLFDDTNNLRAHNESVAFETHTHQTGQQD